MLISRRRFNRYLFGALGATMTAPVLAQLVEDQDLIEGKDWSPITPPQPGDAPDKVEVLEFFSYGCPHCRSFNPIVKIWASQLPEDVSFRRVPVSFGRTAWANLARLYFTLESSGELERLDQAVFDALHQERKRLYTESSIMEWLEAQNVDVEQARALFDSFDIEAQLRRSDYLVQHYQINAVPRLTVGGRYQVLGEGAQGFDALLAIADQLIARVHAESSA